MCNFRYVLFDLDGTISDTSEGIYNCVYYVADKLGFERPREEDMPKFIGPPLHESLVKYSPGVTEENVDDVVELYRQRYFSVGVKECKLYDGMYDLFKHLYGNGVKIALATAKPEVAAIDCLEYLGVLKFFDFTAGLKRKDETKTEIVKRALDGLKNPDKAKTLMVGDRDYDAIGAKENGIKCAGVKFGFGTEEEFTKNGAIAYVNDASELEKLILG